jgi:poly(A) polymerase
VQYPCAEQCLAENLGIELAQLNQALANTDARISEGKSVTPAFLYAALLWGPMRAEAARLQAEGMGEMQALQQSSRDVFTEQSRHAILPRRFSTQTREIWLLQPRLQRNTGKRAARMLEHPRFRAAYDFLLLRAAAGEESVREVAEWWTRFQETDESGRAGLATPPPAPAPEGAGAEGDSLTPGERRPRRRRRRKPRSKATPAA